MVAILYFGISHTLNVNVYVPQNCRLLFQLNGPDDLPENRLSNRCENLAPIICTAHLNILAPATTEGPQHGSYGNALRPSVHPSHFLVKSITLQWVKLRWRYLVVRFFWLGSRTSSNVGNLDLLFYLLYQVTRVTLVKSITLWVTLTFLTYFSRS